MKLSYVSLRALAHHTRTMRRIGHDVRTLDPKLNWTTTYDVMIGGKRFTLWSREVSPSASLYVITVDGRVRFVDRSSIFSTAMEAWEAITGIRYLGIYLHGSPVYGHRERVTLVEKAGPMALFLNYTKPILRTQRVPSGSLWKSRHDPFFLSAAAA